MRLIWTRFISERRGATAIEYALIAAILGVGILGTLTALGSSLNGLFTNVASSFH